MQMDKDGVEIRRWDSINACFKENGWGRHGITNACNGVHQFAYGFRWKFIDKNKLL